MAQVTAAFGIRGVFEGFLHEQDGVVYRFVPPSAAVHGRLAGHPVPPRQAGQAPRPRTVDRGSALPGVPGRELELAARDLTSMPWPELIRVPRQALDLVQPVTDLRIDYLPASGLALLRLLLVVKALRRGALFGELITGARTRTSDANQALERTWLRRRGRRERSTRTRCPRASLREVAGLPRRVRAPRDGEPDPGLTAHLGGSTGDRSRHAQGARGRVAFARPPTGRATGCCATRCCAAPRRRAAIARWVEAARAGVAFREDSHFYFTLPLPVLRRSLLEIGARLRDAGVLQRPEDVFHLRLEELESVKDLPASGLPPPAWPRPIRASTGCVWSCSSGRPSGRNCRAYGSSTRARSSRPATWATRS